MIIRKVVSISVKLQEGLGYMVSWGGGGWVRRGKKVHSFRWGLKHSGKLLGYIVTVQRKTIYSIYILNNEKQEFDGKVKLIL